MAAPVLVCACAVALLLAAEWRGSERGRWLAKPVAAAAFVWAAWRGDPLASAYGRLLFAGLALSFCGDVLLIPTGRPGWFRAGVAAFGAGHVAYAAAFATRPLSPFVLLGAALALAAALFALHRWLLPHAPPALRGPLRGYFAVIGCMAALACAVSAAGGAPAIAVGALGFGLSDLSVARDRFVRPGFANVAWGLPLYFASQLLLASTAWTRA
jgi:uncharacterized membrane protein YhhN